MATRTRKTKGSTDTSPPVVMQPGMKQVTKTEKFFEPVQEQNKGAPASQVIIQATAHPETEEELDPLESWLEKIDAEQGLKMRVDRVNDYHLTGIWGKGANVTYCGEFPVSIQALANDSYLQTLQSGYGPGAYRLQLKYSDGKFIKLFFQQIGGTHQQPQAPVMPFSAQPQAPVKNSMSELVEQLKQYAELRKLLLPEGAAVAAAPAQPAAPAPDKDISEKLIDALLQRAVTSGDQDQVSRILDRVIGREEKQQSWIDVLKDILPSVAPLGLELFNWYRSNVLAPQTGAPLPAQAPQLPPAQIQQAQPAADATGPPPEQDPAISLLQIIRIQANEAYNVQTAVDAFFDYTDKYQTTEDYQKVELLVAGNPQFILQNLQLPSSIERVNWILEFQREIKTQMEASEAIDDDPIQQ